MVEYNDEGEPVSAEVSELARVLYESLGSNWEIDFQGGYYEAADAVLASEWLRVKLRDAFDSGVSIAGRYGHEDYWDDEMNPYNDNPYRTEDEKEF